MTTSDQQRRLRLFNEKAEQLLRQPLLRARTVEIKLQGDTESNEKRRTLAGGTKADIDAFVLTARPFVQDHDGISFRSVIEIYADQDVPRSIADRFQSAVTAMWSDSA
jgi:hypothetical protein